MGVTNKTHLKRLVNVFGAILVRLFGRKLRLLKLQKLTPKNLQLNYGKWLNYELNYGYFPFKLEKVCLVSTTRLGVLFTSISS